jgi:hypothetical protein
MAFYADIYGYIARKEAEAIPAEVLERARQSAAIFRVAFAAPVSCRAAHYSSFACGVKFDEGEDELWLAPFELVLKSIHFLSAAVNIVHEESGHIMMYSYVKSGLIKRFSSRLTEQVVKESVVA